MLLFCYKGSLIRTDIPSFNRSMLVKYGIIVSLKHFTFFVRQNFECLIETFHYQSAYNHGKPQCEVSVFEIPFLIL